MGLHRPRIRRLAEHSLECPLAYEKKSLFFPLGTYYVWSIVSRFCQPWSSLALAISPAMMNPSLRDEGTPASSTTIWNEAADRVTNDPSIMEANGAKGELLPTPEEQIDALGIQNWRELEKKVVKRLNMTLLPCLWVLYLFNYLDRASIAQARLSSLDEDLNLQGYQYGTAVSILSVGYVLGQITSNMIIGKVRPSLYLCCMALVWSSVSAATCGVKNYQGLIAVRFFSRRIRSPVAIYVMSCWCTRREMALRCAILYTGQTLAFRTACLIAEAVLGALEGKHGLAG
ncbi:major facilitator superfamily domain-containing protein [Colletotrichum cereale]|nr:major facilitator superfamily domain-containing protein [Colletotrichum cereale]